MAKNESSIIWIVAIVAVVLLMNQQQAPPPPPDNGGNDNGGGTDVDLCRLVDGQASFTGVNKYLKGTALTTDFVRVIKQGSIMDLGQISMNSGTVSLSPSATYKLYYGENTSSDTRYTSVETYVAPCQDATDNKVGTLCTVDTAPTITIYNSDGQVLTNGSNVQAIAQDEVVDVEVKVKVAADKCYGNPESGKKNAICFGYNSTTYESVKANTPSSAATPYSIGNIQSTGFATSCYELNLLEDTASQILTVTLKPASGKNPAPDSSDNITIKLEDVDFDLNQDTLEEIWGFEDESNNNLGATRIVGKSHTIGVN